ncbi:MAG: PTS sugar transporter subunit IIC [Turicibacter sp.]|nr:PTS sugar transporter subunit IIC [Turicibacter sp.]
MNNFTAFLEEKVSGPMAKLSHQRHIRAIRDGIVSTIPFIIVGSIFLILAAPPLPEGNAIRDWLLQYSGQMILPFRVSMFIMTIYATFGIGYSLAQSYDLDGLSGGQLALLALLLTTLPSAVEGMGWMLPLANLGGAGLFVGMLVSIFAVEIQRFCKAKNLTIKMPDQVPPSVSRSFATIIPAAIVMVIIGAITIVFGVDLHSLMIRLVSPIAVAGDSIFGALFFTFLNSFFWSFGIHGSSVVGAIARPFWLMYSEANAAAVAAGTPLPFVAPETFYQWFVYIGGSGATLGMIIAGLIVGRSKQLKALSKACLVPGLFNINEPVIFGMPVVLNPILMIPFIIVPLVNVLIAYTATSIGWVNATSAIAPWTLPAPIGALISTGGDVRAVFLTLILIALSVVIYLPFVRIYDQSLLKDERAEITE